MTISSQTLCFEARRKCRVGFIHTQLASSHANAPQKLASSSSTVGFITRDFHTLISRQHSHISSVDALLTTQNVLSWSGRGHTGWSQLQLASSVSPLWSWLTPQTVILIISPNVDFLTDLYLRPYCMLHLIWGTCKMTLNSRSCQGRINHILEVIGYVNTNPSFTLIHWISRKIYTIYCLLNPKMLLLKSPFLQIRPSCTQVWIYDIT